MPLHLPPLASLRIFDAAARLGSFSRAAAELHLTPSAVSHGINSLETWLGTRLFLRDGRSVSLTEAGEAFRPYVADALSMIAVGAKRVSPLQEARRISLSVAPTFASHWLLPRLRGFQDRHPGLTLRIDTSHSQVLFPLDDIDLAIRMGEVPLPRSRSALLFREALLPVASPEVAARLASDDGRVKWEEAVLIHLGTAGQDWDTWSERNGLALQPAGHLVFDTARLALDAAAGGMGIALARDPLCRTEIESGRVVPLGFALLPIETGYWLTLPGGQEPREDVRAFLKWLCAEAGCIDELSSSK